MRLLTFVIKRIVIGIILLVIISFISFSLVELAPGSYLESLKINPNISEQQIKVLERTYGLDKSFLGRYGSWLNGIVHLDLGYSLVHKQPVAVILKQRLFATLFLSIVSLIFTWMLAIPLGIYLAVHLHNTSSKVIRFFGLAAISTPSFFLAILLLLIASKTYGFWPTGSMTSLQFDFFSTPAKIVDLLKHVTIPAICVSIGGVAGLMRITEGNVLDELHKNYIYYARAKGLPEKKVIYKHAVRNAINPLITIFGYELSGLLSGAALTEIVTNWPGMGSMMLQAVLSYDTHLILGGIVLSGALLLVGNLLADIALVYADPRIKYQKNS